MHDLDGLVDLIERKADMLVEFLAVFGQADVAAHALEEGNADLFLKVLDGVGKRGLRNIEAFGCFTVMLIFR